MSEKMYWEILTLNEQIKEILKAIPILTVGTFIFLFLSIAFHNENWITWSLLFLILFVIMYPRILKNAARKKETKE